jgi:capsular polysaccharide biosynthesis protein
MKIIKLEYRGFWTFHWVLLVLSSFRNISKEDIILLDIPNNKSTEYCYESLKYFPEHKFIFSLNDISGNYEIVHYHGEPLLSSGIRVCDEAYIYIRNQILSNYKNTNKFMNEKIYIRRNKQSLLIYNNNAIGRNLINEEILIGFLEKKGFKIIDLEDYCFNDKIDLFQNAHTVISVTGGALTFSLFASNTTNIIELYPHDKVGGKKYYITIYDIIKLNYKLFMDLDLIYTSTPGNDFNLYIHINSFSEFINTQYAN